jgi:predicted small integral membrane protein
LLRIETTRGDRLFISLLGSAFICLAWLGLVGPNLLWALGLCIVFAILVFLTV